MNYFPPLVLTPFTRNTSRVASESGSLGCHVVHPVPSSEVALEGVQQAFHDLNIKNRSDSRLVAGSACLDSEEKKFENEQPKSPPAPLKEPLEKKDLISGNLDVLTSPAGIQYFNGKPIGKGSFGTVYRVSGIGLNGEVHDFAMKVSRPGESSILKKESEILVYLNKEAKNAGKSSIAIARVFDHFCFNKCYFMVSELYSYNLLKLIESKPNEGFSLRTVRSIGSQLVDALAFIHRENIVHADLKPDNIMITEEGRVHLIDFGLACPAERDPWKATPSFGYRAPESILRMFGVSGALDMWALGCILRELYTGQFLFLQNTKKNLDLMDGEMEGELLCELPQFFNLLFNIDESWLEYHLARNPLLPPESVDELVENLQNVLTKKKLEHLVRISTTEPATVEVFYKILNLIHCKPGMENHPNWLEFTDQVNSLIGAHLAKKFNKQSELVRENALLKDPTKLNEFTETHKSIHCKPSAKIDKELLAFMDLFRLMMMPDPRARLTARDALEHRFFL
jgi:serine/threonine protein kinase